MENNQEKVQKILDDMEGKNSEAQLTEAFNILTKLVTNIISNPFEPKFRTVKTTNNTIKSKVMNIKLMNDLLLQLGYTPSADETYVLKDQNIGDFLQGAPAIDYRRRLYVAKMTSNEAYEKEKELIKIHRQQQHQKAVKEKQARRLKQQCSYDQKQRKHMKVDDTKSRNLKFGANSNTFKDIGIDLCAKKGG